MVKQGFFIPTCVKTHSLPSSSLSSNKCPKTTDVSETNLRYTETPIDNVWSYVNTQENSEICLLRKRDVIRWLFDDLSFLTLEEEHKTKGSRNNALKDKENEWGTSLLKEIRPDCWRGKPMQTNWTTLVGECIAKEVLSLMGEASKKPKILSGYSPDLETEQYIYEVKTQTYYTTGTAGEKILGVPYKYSEVPRLYSKPLYIMCVACAEKMGREKYGILPGNKITKNRQTMLDCYKEMDIQYVGITDLLLKCVTKL